MCYSDATNVIRIYPKVSLCSRTQKTWLAKTTWRMQSHSTATSTLFPDVLQPFNHRPIVLHNLFLYYVRYGRFPEASGVTQRLEGRGARRSEGSDVVKNTFEPWESDPSLLEHWPSQSPLWLRADRPPASGRRSASPSSRLSPPSSSLLCWPSSPAPAPPQTPRTWLRPKLAALRRSAGRGGKTIKIQTIMECLHCFH